jgi:serine/threonine protein phosphatase PrpC
LQSEPQPQRGAEKLVALANESGGLDNVTVIVVSLRPERKGWFSWLRRGAHKSADANGSAGGR